MKKLNFKALMPHFIIIALFVVVSVVYFMPALEGKVLQQGDMLHSQGMQKELKDYHEKTGEYAHWTNSMFGGMPAYQILGEPVFNIYGKLTPIARGYLPYYHIGIVFLCLIGFYILLQAFKVNPWLSMVGALAFAFSTYNIIIIEAGHITKAYAIAYMAPALAGVWLTYQRKYIWGAVVTSIFLGLNIYSYHVQITYYLFLMIGVFVIFNFIYSLIEKQIKNFLIASMVLFASVVIGVLPNFSSLWITYEYSKDTIRGTSELSSTKKTNGEEGLDKDYATAWSYGKAESFTLLVPSAFGGASNMELSNNSNLYKAFVQKGAPNPQDYVKSSPTYWGEMPFTSGPVYFGAIICFLFVLGMFIVEGKIKWWLFAATVLSLLLSWGRNLEWFNDLFFNFAPFYNKFRTVSMALVIAGLTMPLLGILAMHKILSGEVAKEKLMKALKISLGIVGGILLLLVVMPGAFFDFTSTNDQQMNNEQYKWYLEALIADRESMLRLSALKSLFLVVVAVTLIWMFIKNKLNYTKVALILAALVLFDLWWEDKKYLNEDNFLPKRSVNQAFTPSPADLQILQDKDNFRVFNTTINPFNEAQTAYFHKSVGGYHPAKLRRYQDLIEYHLSKYNMKVLNMLNTKYFIVAEKGKNVPMAQLNPEALGNAWYVDSIIWVNNPDEEINALNTFDPKRNLVIDKRFAEIVGKPNVVADSISKITLKEYNPEKLVYESNANSEKLTVFSEVYYDKGWKAYIDGKEMPHFRANYVLRAMVIPAGKHEVMFKFEPTSYYKGKQISTIGSIAALILILAGIAVALKQNGIIFPKKEVK